MAFFTFKPSRIFYTVAAVVCRNEKVVVFIVLLMSTMLGCLSKWSAHFETKSTFVSVFCDTFMFSPIVEAPNGITSDSNSQVSL